ncbi:MAG TPA: DUF418 domain-containing protein [Vicinamibacterales bacterium]|nr:DUF418 domain-containing protein [Vicinamibacterales bacterium]
MNPRERIHSLDILRGLALLGMFIVHFHMRSTEPGGIDDVVRTLVWRLVESKSHGTFALLFGAGFAIQLRRAEARGRPFTAFYLRRLVALAAFGFVAHAGFGFNVLLGYAIWGVPLLAIRRWSTRALIVLAIFSATSVPVYHLVHQQYLARTGGPDAVRMTYEARRATAVAVNDALHAAERQESYRVLVAARLAHMAWFYRQPFFFMPGATLTLFIVGLLLVRHRVFEDARAHPRVLSVMAVFGVVSWLADNWLLDRWQLQLFGIVFHDQWLTFAYVAAALWLLARWPALADRLRPVANAGRMALTNYLLQIAALDLLFSGYAVGLAQIRPVVGFGAALACYATEVLSSRLWLTRFRFGPAEWLWRSLTYWRVQPMRQDAPRAEVEPA